MALTSLAAIVPPAQWTKVHHASVIPFGLVSSERDDPGVAYTPLFPGGEAPRSYMRIL
jgi:hypothetical protein